MRMSEEQLNPYQAPEQIAIAASPQPVMMQADCLLVPREYVFPPICLKSGTVDDLTGPITRKLVWYHPAWAILLVLNVIIFIIVVLCIQKTGKLTFYLSREERRIRRRKVLTAWIFFFAAIGLIVASSFELIPWEFTGIGSVVCVITSLVIATVWARLIAPRRIDQQWIYLRIKNPVVLQRVYQACTDARQA